MPEIFIRSIYQQRQVPYIPIVFWLFGRWWRLCKLKFHGS